MSSWLVRVQTTTLPGLPDSGRPWMSGAQQAVVEADTADEARLEGANRLGVPAHSLSVTAFVRGS